MFRLLAITAIISFVSAHCSDKLFFEKNQISQYTRYSRTREHTRSSVPALDWVIDLQKNDFGTHIYDSIIRKDDVFMLFAYKSSIGLYVYRVCPSIPDKITGPLQNHEHLMGYHFQMNDEHRLKKHFVDFDFKLFSEDESALRREIVEDRREILMVKKQSTEGSFIRKLLRYFWVFLIASYVVTPYLPDTHLLTLAVGAAAVIGLWC